MRSMPAYAEYLIVVLVVFGWPVVISLVRLFHPASAPMLDDRHILASLIEEPVLIVVVGAFLFMRGWTLSSIGLVRLRWVDFAIGLALFLGALALYYGSWIAGVVLAPDFMRQIKPRLVVGSDLNGVLTILTVIINPVFEELFVGAYLINATKRHGWVVLGVILSIVIRTSYHLYQGPLALFGIGPGAVLFAVYFARSGRLWPLIFAHLALDAASILPHVK